MNAKQRKELADLRSRIESQSNRLEGIVSELDTPIDEDEKKAHHDTINDVCEKLEDINTEVEQIKEDEEEKFGNMPEGLQDAEGGQKIEAAAEALGEAFGYIESAVYMLRCKLEPHEDLVTRLTEVKEDDMQNAIDQLEAAAE